tara:strand:- start:2488 stop:3009 length:522 start_codon:yes stop_codon:yes gene_type:complete
MKCTKSEKYIIKAIHKSQIWTNIIYIICSLFALILKEWLLCIVGIIAGIISILHHYYNYIDAKCIIDKKHFKYKLLGNMDLFSSNLLIIIGGYSMYKKGKKLTLIYILLYIFTIIFSLILFYISSQIYENNSFTKNINSQEYIKNATLYDFYHGYWHIISGINYILTIIWLSS